MSEFRTILVGDVGGTNVRFALARSGSDGVKLSQVWKRPGRDFPDFMAAMSAFRAAHTDKLDGAAFGLAGIVEGGAVSLLHRPWTVRSAEVAASLSVGRVVLVNDFEAMARSAPELAPSESIDISKGQARSGSIVVAGPGTGLGLATLKQAGSAGWIVIGGEGGHQLFAPQDEFEWALAQRLRAIHGYVSNEHVASGSGFENLLAAAASVLGVPRPSATPEDIERRAEAGEELALAVCRVRAGTVMAAAGDAALAANASGGVWLAGGVGQALEPWLKESRALDRFYVRGPRTEFMAGISIRLITSDLAPLLGAAWLWLDEERRGWI